MKTLLEVLEEAREVVDTYRNPDLSEFRERFCPLTKALGQGSFEHDKITSISVYNEMLHINTEYEVRCCRQTGEYRIPMDVVRSAKPIKYVKVAALTIELEKAKRELASHTAGVTRWTKTVAQTEIDLRKALADMDT